MLPSTCVPATWLARSLLKPARRSYGGFMFALRRGAWVRFYPTFLFLIAIAQRALA